MSLTGKGPMGQKEPKAKRNPKHLARVKALPCVICRKPGPSDAHHVISGRYSQRKACDFDTIPLCKRHHQHGPDAIHENKAAWEQANGPDWGFLPLVRAWLDPNNEIDF